MDYMDDPMGIVSAAKLNLGMFHASRSSDFRVYGLGIRELMPPGKVDRPAGTRDYLFMHFHTRVVLVGDEGPSWHPADSFVLWEPGAAHLYGNTEKRWSHSWLHCDGASVESAVSSSELPLNRPIPLGDAALAETSLWSLHDEISGNRRPDRVIVENLVQIWIRRIRRAVHPVAEKAIPSRVLAAQAHLDSRFAADITLESLASFAGMSASYLSAEFRKHIGMPPMRYLLETRLTRAAYLLADVNMSISEVAREVGFRDPLYFSRQFRKRFGLSPRPYRRQLG